jgi:hypothetical protein
MGRPREEECISAPDRAAVLRRHVGPRGVTGKRSFTRPRLNTIEQIRPAVARKTERSGESLSSPFDLSAGLAVHVEKSDGSPPDGNGDLFP